MGWLLALGLATWAGWTAARLTALARDVRHAQADLDAVRSRAAAGDDARLREAAAYLEATVAADAAMRRRLMARLVSPLLRLTPRGRMW